MAEDRSLPRPWQAQENVSGHALHPHLSAQREASADPARASRARELDDRDLIRTGLLGGSFNPAHRGHRGISAGAIDALGLDEMWWLVSPGNPLKDEADMA